MSKFIFILIMSLSMKIESAIYNYPVIDRTLIKQVLKNSPKIDINYAKRLVQSTSKHAKAFGLSAKVMLAVCMQESKYKLNTVSKTHDYGICQINILNIKHYNLDKKRLLTDLDYSIEKSCMIMSQFKHKKDKNWFSFYNSSNPIAREKYKLAVSRWF